MKYICELWHYNPNHDPKNGQFTSGKTVFVSGSSKTQSRDSEYYRKKLPKEIRKELKRHIKERDAIVVGDAPGIDRQVQDYLKKKRYDLVTVYGPGEKVRYSADNRWETRAINDPKHEPGSKQWLAKKDIAMTKAATEGLAITLDEGSRATRKNIERLLTKHKDVKVYTLSKEGKKHDDWANNITKKKKQDATKKGVKTSFLSLEGEQEYQNLIKKYGYEKKNNPEKEAAWDKFERDETARMYRDRYGLDEKAVRRVLKAYDKDHIKNLKKEYGDDWKKHFHSSVV